MTPFDVTYREVADERLSELLAAANAAGFATPTLTPAGAGAPSRESGLPDSQLSAADPFDGDADLPDAWRRVGEMDGQAYTWPEERESYDEYLVYAGETQRDGTVHIALGTNLSHWAWGDERIHIVAFLTSGSPQTPLAEFQGVDDFEQSRELIAVIRGQGGFKSKKMFGPGDPLPRVYAQCFRTALYNDRIRVRGAWAKVGVLTRDHEHEVMLNHALVQARRRGDL